MKIVLLGFGSLGEQVLLSALQRNVFSPQQNIEYHIFGDAKAFCGMHSQLDQINDLLDLAKRINLRYAHLYGGVEEPPKNAENEWRKLNSFLHYSNLYAAEYHDLRLQMMKTWGYPEKDELTPSTWRF